MRSARLVADLPKLKAAVDLGDPPTARPLAEEYQAAARCRAADAHRPRRSDPGGRRHEELGAAAARLAPISRRAARPRGERVRGRPPGGLLQLATVPVMIGPDPPEVLGTLSVGFVLDDGLAHASRRSPTATSRSRSTGASRPRPSRGGRCRRSRRCCTGAAWCASRSTARTTRCCCGLSDRRPAPATPPRPGSPPRRRSSGASRPRSCCARARSSCASWASCTRSWR